MTGVSTCNVNKLKLNEISEVFAKPIFHDTMCIVRSLCSPQGVKKGINLFHRHVCDGVADGRQYDGILLRSVSGGLAKKVLIKIGLR